MNKKWIIALITLMLFSCGEKDLKIQEPQMDSAYLTEPSKPQTTYEDAWVALYKYIEMHPDDSDSEHLGYTYYPCVDSSKLVFEIVHENEIVLSIETREFLHISTEIHLYRENSVMCKITNNYFELPDLFEDASGEIQMFLSSTEAEICGISSVYNDFLLEPLMINKALSEEEKQTFNMYGNINVGDILKYFAEWIYIVRFEYNIRDFGFNP